MSAPATFAPPSPGPAGPHEEAVFPGGEALPASTGWEEFAQETLFLVVDIGLVALTIAFIICLWRLIKGPTLVDRGLATDTIALQVVGLAILITIRLRSLVYFDAVLIVAILGFASTVAFAQFIGRRRAV